MKYIFILLLLVSVNLFGQKKEVIGVSFPKCYGERWVKSATDSVNIGCGFWFYVQTKDSTYEVKGNRLLIKEGDTVAIFKTYVIKGNLRFERRF